jgi:hypothetical protein
MRVFYYVALMAMTASTACSGSKRSIEQENIEIVRERELTVPARSNSIGYKIYYGKKLKGYDLSGRDVRSIHDPRKKYEVGTNDDHVIILEYGDRKRLYFPVGRVAVIEAFPQKNGGSVSSVLCSFDGKLDISGVFLGSEDGGGILHYNNGWKWHHCSD